MTPIRLSWLAVPVLNTLFQIFIKRGAEDMGETGGMWHWLGGALQSHWVLAAIAVEIICFFLWMNILSELDLSKAFPLSAVSYVMVIASGWLIFGEPVMRLQVIGSILILTGVWLIAIASKGEDKTHEVTETQCRASL
ncbi:EamA family transporter [Agrobacterium vaccinii]|uniref:EamA family transporter n=1 Tax=Agrobacterium vaccinii TaxID=2735528 RepID=UPI001E50EC60|nr:EamA family transporter [Agrobacterium vaccinii]UHS58677.1 EamA family transporter [Agrobacterium vaccinii]